MASLGSDSLSTQVSRRRRKILNDGIFELTDEDRDTPSPNIDSTIEHGCDIAQTGINDVPKSSVEPANLNVLIENSVESGELFSEGSHTSNDEIHELKHENERLVREIEFLKSNKCICNQTTEGPEPKKPLLTIAFRDKDISLKYKKEIISFIDNLIHCSPSKECSDSDLEIDFWENDSEMDDYEIQNLFVLDADPGITINYRDIPYYKNISEQTITEEIKINAHENKNNHVSMNCCFNCGDFHQLRDCPLPRNHDRINAARQKFSRSTTGKASRYHQEDDEMNEHFAHLKPGRISDKLRSALGLRRYELPRYIYKMRVLGYPPGWWEEAKQSKSGLKMFTEMKENDNTLPEIISEDMIHEYPGFNVPASHGTKDEHQYYKCPPYQQFQTKEAFLKLVLGPSAKKQKMNTNNPPGVDISISDMDVDDISQDVSKSDSKLKTINENNIDIIGTPVSMIAPPGEEDLLIPPLPVEFLEKPPPPPEDLPPQVIANTDSSEELSLSSADQNSQSSRAMSPSLSDLEQQKLLLLSELQQDGAEKSNSTVIEDKDSNLHHADVSIIDLTETSTANNTNEDISKLNDSVVLLTPKIPIIDLVSPVNKHNDSTNKDSSTLTNTPVKQSYNTITDMLHTPLITKDHDLSEIPLPISINNSHTNCSLSRSKSSSHLGAVKSVSHGTPILKSISPYAKLPDQSKFAKDMGPIINFENLPDATGKYEQMKDLIKKVRVSVKQISERFNKN